MPEQSETQENQTKKQPDKEPKQSLDPIDLIGRYGKKYIASVKKDRLTQILSAVLIIAIGLLYWGYQKITDKPMGTYKYGVCKAFIERYYQYPASANIIAAAEGFTSATLYFSIRNAFGDQSMFLMECIYDRDDERGIYLKDVKIDGFPADPDFVRSFSDTMKFMVTVDMDYELPTGFSLDLKTYKARDNIPLDPVYRK